MAGNKTIATDAPVSDLINALEDERRRQDSLDMIALMRNVTGHKPRLWGTSLVGFGSYHYRYASGREGDFFLTGFAPRKSAFTIYIMPGFEPYQSLLKRLGPHRTGKSCLYLKNLGTVDRGVLEEIIRDSVARMREKYA
jgi:Domain of unknown function (DU1801)